MALVAGYGSSDDDDDDGDEVVVAVSPLTGSVAKPSAADEPSENRSDPLASASHASLRLPPPAAAPEQTSEGALEDFVKSKSYENAAASDAAAPVPRPQRSSALKLPPPKYKERQTVKITVPALSSYDSDEDDGRASKKPKTAAAGAAGLLSCLPPPRNTTVKDLVPHSLTKAAPPALRRAVAQQPAAAAAAAAAAKRPPSAAGVAASVASSLRDRPRDDDEDGGEGSADFFSLESAPRPSSYSAGPASGNAGSALWASALPTAYSRPAASEIGSPATEAYGSYDGASAEAIVQRPETSSADSCSAAAAGVYEEAIAGTSAPPLPSQSAMLADEQFLRLQGKKQRGKEEINIVDVCEDDFRASQLELTKTLSQEVDPRSFSHRKKGEGPSTQEKRKHQITYLAFQAKERELELKNAWAANRVTRQQTQSKYGF